MSLPGSAPRPGETFSTILADPNWGYQNFGLAKHGAQRAHYGGSTVDQLSALAPAVQGLARRSTILLLWGVNPKPDEAIDVIRAWGFQVVTSLPWVKTIPNTESIAQGPGFWFYGCAETLYVCKQASRSTSRAPAKELEKFRGLLHGDRHAGEDAVFYAPRGAHSAKPMSLYDWIGSRLPGPRLELFARVATPGWRAVGSELGSWLAPSGVISADEARAQGLLVDVAA